jgi:hypothetical protein
MTCDAQGVASTPVVIETRDNGIGTRWLKYVVINLEVPTIVSLSHQIVVGRYQFEDWIGPGGPIHRDRDNLASRAAEMPMIRIAICCCTLLTRDWFAGSASHQ